jgi:hypothetical protein
MAASWGAHSITGVRTPASLLPNGQLFLASFLASLLMVRPYLASLLPCLFSQVPRACAGSLQGARPIGRRRKPPLGDPALGTLDNPRGLAGLLPGAEGAGLCGLNRRFSDNPAAGLLPGFCRVICCLRGLIGRCLRIGWGRIVFGLRGAVRRPLSQPPLDRLGLSLGERALPGTSPVLGFAGGLNLGLSPGLLVIRAIDIVRMSMARAARNARP